MGCIDVPMEGLLHPLSSKEDRLRAGGVEGCQFEGWPSLLCSALLTLYLAFFLLCHR